MLSSSTISNIFSSETAWPIKAKFHVEPPREGGTKVYIKWSRPHDLDGRHLCQKPLKIFFSRIRSPMILKLGMQYRELKLYKVYINDDNPVLTLTYFTARSNWVAYSFEWGKLLQSHLMGKSCSKGLNLLNKYVNEKKLTPVACLPLPRGYIHVYDHRFQRSFSLKLLGQSKPNFMWSQNRKSYDLETWHAASGTQALPSVYK